jgi:hypothetical protein
VSTKDSCPVESLRKIRPEMGAPDAATPERFDVAGGVVELAPVPPPQLQIVNITVLAKASVSAFSESFIATPSMNEG